MKYKVLNGWTKKKMIEKLREHIPTNEPCMSDTGNQCSYLNKEGKRCAAGAFLPNDFDDFESEDSINHLIESFPELESQLPLIPYQLRILQSIHDSFSKHNKSISQDMSALGGTAQDACVAWVEKCVED